MNISSSSEAVFDLKFEHTQGEVSDMFSADFTPNQLSCLHK